MRIVFQPAVLTLGLFIGLAATASGCREEPSKKECEVAAKKRVRFFFGKGTDTGSERQTKRASKMEYENSVEECMAGWSKSKARCVGEAKNRNMMISCK
tara:strand:- start:15152 stop:15448 length:297 start_codon:yes stop_codon:yes gene_type:complete